MMFLGRRSACQGLLRAQHEEDWGLTVRFSDMEVTGDRECVYVCESVLTKIINSEALRRWAHGSNCRGDNARENPAFVVRLNVLLTSLGHLLPLRWSNHNNLCILKIRLEMQSTQCDLWISVDLEFLSLLPLHYHSAWDIIDIIDNQYMSNEGIKNEYYWLSRYQPTSD